MKKTLRAFFALFALTVCLTCALSTPAQAAASLPYSEELQDSFGYSDSTRNTLDNIWRTLTNYGGPYYCKQAAERSVIQAPGDAPAEDAVATLQLCVRSKESDSMVNINGHAFLVVENISDTDQIVGSAVLAPGTCISLGTFSNLEEHVGLWYGLECFRTVAGQHNYNSSIGIQTSLNADQLAVLTKNLLKADHWSTVYNCSSFAVAMWNSVCADTVDPAAPCSPATLKADVMQRYAEFYNPQLSLRCYYPARYSTALIPSVEFC